MTLTQFLILLLVAGICGSIGQAIAGYSRGGCLVSIALGFIGALLGTYLAHALGLPELPVTHIESSCATGNDAVRNALFGIASGAFDVALVIGADKNLLPNAGDWILMPRHVAREATPEPLPDPPPPAVDGDHRGFEPPPI